MRYEGIRALMCDCKLYEKGFKDGMQAALEKIASELNQHDPEICLLYAMGWEDEGCCMDCVECVKNHFMKKEGAK